jgi:hypothetical protein
MEKNRIIILSVLLLGTSGRYFTQDNTAIRTVDFVQIFVMGILCGLLSFSLINKFKSKK